MILSHQRATQGQPSLQGTLKPSVPAPTHISATVDANRDDRALREELGGGNVYPVVSVYGVVGVVESGQPYTGQRRSSIDDFSSRPNGAAFQRRSIIRRNAVLNNTARISSWRGIIQSQFSRTFILHPLAGNMTISGPAFSPAQRPIRHVLTSLPTFRRKSFCDRSPRSSKFAV